MARQQLPLTVSSDGSGHQPAGLQFNVSSGLKNVLGSELITDDEVAIFELVKNSFDAGAKRVDIHFSGRQIVVSDDGSGMSYEDIRSKWLVVAYSSKRQSERRNDFRESVLDRKHYAGSKGIGRFSADRLGQVVVLQTRSAGELNGPVHSVTVDWNDFETDLKKRFESIEVIYSADSSIFILPKELPVLSHGTAITIGKTRRTWNREKILALKSALTKLINPFGASTDNFRIFLHAPDELQEDKRVKTRSNRKGEEPPPNTIVNSEVGNFVFAALQEKTTYLEVLSSDGGERIISTLIDRGELIYRISESNKYPQLKESGIQCRLFFLNQSAKHTFARRMGVPSIRFGSVFLFRNGFRVYPIGEEGDDWFKMDSRKQQGYARYLGTRDVIGRIDVAGADRNFQEASSRNAGLIETTAVGQLRKFFIEHCLKRLERYVVPVTFVDKEDKNTGDVSRLSTDPGKARVALAVAKLVNDSDIELIEYSKRLIGILSERSSEFEGSLASLRAIAEKTKDSDLFKSLEEAEHRFNELKKAEEVAKKLADEERRAKEDAQARADAAEKKASDYAEKFDEEKKRNLFLTSISSLDTDTILGLHHQVTIYAVDIQQQIENFLVRASSQQSIPKSDIISLLDGITLLNRKILGVSKFATKANFRLESEKITADLGSYIEQYVSGVAKDFLDRRISVHVSSDGKSFNWSFKPIDISVVIDNLISNARKARASKVTFDVTHPSKNSLYLTVTDNGNGLHKTIDDPERLFEKGFSKTDGAGLGLYHVRQVLGEMGGSIEVLPPESGKGARFLIRISQ